MNGKTRVLKLDFCFLGKRKIEVTALINYESNIYQHRIREIPVGTLDSFHAPHI